MQEHEDILKQVKLSKEELEDLLRKYNDFVNSLNPAQRRAFLRNQPTAHHAINTLRRVTVEQLEEFLRRHAPKHGTICFVGNIFNGE